MYFKFYSRRSFSLGPLAAEHFLKIFAPHGQDELVRGDELPLNGKCYVSIFL